MIVNEDVHELFYEGQYWRKWQVIEFEPLFTKIGKSKDNLKGYL